MISAARFLANRLGAPDPRIRAEAAKSIARAIKEGDSVVKSAFLDWIASRELESEAASSLAIILAFDLGAYFTPAEVDAVNGAPSILSQILMGQVFPGQDLRGRRLGYAPLDAKPDDDLATYFNSKDRQFIAPIFTTNLRGLGRGGEMLLDRWRTEWCWLQATRREPFSDLPRVLWGNAPLSNYVDFQARQTEMFLSAYLRALAFGAEQLGLPVGRAKDLALDGLALNAGLGVVEPLARPSWSVGVSIALLKGDGAICAQALWAAAQASAPEGHVAISLRTIDHNELGYSDITIFRTLHADDKQPKTGPCEQEFSPSGILVRGVVGGLTGTPDSITRLGKEPVMALSTCLHPTHYGRLHMDFFPNGIQLAHPDLLGAGIIIADQDGIHFVDQDVRLSTWRYWNADWQPTRDRHLRRLGGLITTVNEARLSAYLTHRGAPTGLYCEIAQGVRGATYEDLTRNVEHLWL
ncbi:hypothetical protein [Bosea vaviloviae]|nr:hypothetical protein [Bosea vaviloviae]